MLAECKTLTRSLGYTSSLGIQQLNTQVRFVVYAFIGAPMCACVRMCAHVYVCERVLEVGVR